MLMIDLPNFMEIINSTVLRIATIASTGNMKITLWIIIMNLLKISNKENLKIRETRHYIERDRGKNDNIILVELYKTIRECRSSFKILKGKYNLKFCILTLYIRYNSFKNS